MIKQTFEFDDELRVNRLGYGTMQLHQVNRVQS